MGKDSKIGWTDHTWNPWIGCHKVSPGCKHCYAETLVENRMGRKFSDVHRASPATFNAPLKWHRPMEAFPPSSPQYVFTCSISDFFIEESDAWRDEAWEIIRRTPHLTYQILTKRPERIAEHLPKTCFQCGNEKTQIGKTRCSRCGGSGLQNSVTPGLMATCFGCAGECAYCGRQNTVSGVRHCGCDSGEDPVCHGVSVEKYLDMICRCPQPLFWPWPNVWLGTSVETQQFAEKRIPILTSVPAKVHFLSCEPLLGPIDFQHFYETGSEGQGRNTLLSDIEWTICGGESGPHFRPMDLDWARSIRDQCKAASIPFFFKQGNGLRSETPCGDPTLDSCKEMPDV